MRTKHKITVNLEISMEVEVDSDHFATVRMSSDSRQSVEAQMNEQMVTQLQEVSRTSEPLRPCCWIAAFPCEFTKRR